jgi:PAS domain S-box-containing protein
MSCPSLSHLHSLSAANRWPAGPARASTWALLLSIGYYLGAKMGFALTLESHPVSTLWPPNAILLAALLLAPTRWWWLLLLAAFPAHVFVELNSGIPTIMVLCWFVSNTCEALIGAYCIRRYADGGLRFDSLRSVGLFIAFAVLLAPFASSFLDAAFVKLIGWGTDSYWQVWIMRTLSNALAALILIPVIISLASSGLSFLRRVSAWRYSEAGLLGIGLVIVGLIAFAESGPKLGNVPALVYAPLPFLLWAALRFGPGGLSTSLLATDLLAIWGSTHGRGPFTALSPVETVLPLQAFLILLAVPLMFLSAVITERQKTAQTLRESEERYRSVVETQTELVCRYKLDTTLTFVNDAYCRSFDKTEIELIGRKFLDLIPLDSREKVRKHIQSLVDQPAKTVHEHRVLLPGGGIGWYQWVNRAILDADGNVIEFQGVGRDVTEARRAEEELRQSEERWRLIFDNSAVGIVVTTTEGRFFATNAVFERMFGYAKNELLALTLLDVTDEDYREASRAVMDELLTGKRSQCQIEKRCRRSDGNYIWVSNSISTIHDSQGKSIFLIAVVEDVTERRHAAEGLNKLNAELERRVAERTGALDAKTRELEAFAYSVAHDLKAPLRGIEGYNRILIEDYVDKLDTDGLKLLVNVRSSAEQMNRLIDDLLAYSKIEYQPINSHKLEMGTFLEDLVEERQNELNDDRFEFATAIEHGTVVVDAKALRQALRNYLDNAIKFTQTVAAPRIEVGAEQGESGWRLWVRDNGVGFDIKHSKEVFEIFRRLHHDEDYEGTGVGLAIVRKVIERMNGRVWAESEPGRGSTFFLEIPK